MRKPSAPARIDTRRRSIGGLLAAVVITIAGQGSAIAATQAGLIEAVGVENEYADVISQIGGRYVRVLAIETDPNTDPHSFETSPKIAERIAAAALIVTNGLGYDTWADKIISASPDPKRKVIDVQHLLDLPDDAPNPHLWYDPGTMPVVAKAVAASLSALLPGQTGYFRSNVTRFDVALGPWNAAIASFKANFPNTSVAVTEPVGDAMLQAAGCEIATPFSLQAAIMNGTDPSPQDVTTQDNLFTAHKVKVFVYNRQVTDSLTNSFLHLAKTNGIPVVGVTETMPVPGFSYQSWMLAQTAALRKAVAEQRSTETLQAGPVR